MIAGLVDSVVINAGDGAHAHPTQALLDMLTIRDALGRLEGIKVTIIGDISHSRVARSNIIGLTKMGAEVRVCGPPTMMPPAIEDYGVKVFDRPEAALHQADVIMMLRIQMERADRRLFPGTREYARVYGLTPARAAMAGDNAVIMHPGPMNRGVEISPEVADGPNSVILDQVTNGIAVRMALLYLLIGGEKSA